MMVTVPEARPPVHETACGRRSSAMAFEGVPEPPGVATRGLTSEIADEVRHVLFGTYMERSFISAVGICATNTRRRPAPARISGTDRPFSFICSISIGSLVTSSGRSGSVMVDARGTVVTHKCPARKRHGGRRRGGACTG